MQTFKIKNPADWRHVMLGTKLPVPALGHRQVRLAVNATARVSVFVSETEDMKKPVLVGSADGLFEVEYTAHGPTWLELRSDKGAIIYVRTLTGDPVVPPSEEEPFTTVMPMERRSSELDRIMLWASLNEKRRSQALERDRQAYERKLADLEAKLSKPDAKSDAPVIEPEDKA